MLSLRLVFLCLVLTSALCRHHYHHEHQHLQQQQQYGYGISAFSSASASASVMTGAVGTSVTSFATDSAPSGTTVYTKRRPGRHVCSSEKAVPEQTKTTETYSKPVSLTYKKKCTDQEGMCMAMRTVYHEAFRTVYKTQYKKQTAYMCCPGWTQSPKHQHGCRKAVCTRSCQNGGSCIRPDTCACPPGYTGKYCEADVDECLDKPCDQMCVNTLGSFHCVCREGFTLLTDGRSCRSEGNITATETTDLVDFEIITQRITKLEKEVNNHRNTPPPNPETEKSIRELQKKIDLIYSSINVLQDQIAHVKRKQEEANEVVDTFQSYRGEIERISPLCSQVSSIEHKIQSCNCMTGLSGTRFRYRYNLS